MATDLRPRLVEDLDGGFEVLVRTQQQLVFSVALRWCSSRQEAEDVAQETFVRAYRALGGYEPGRIAALRLRPWLLQIALNVFRNDLRRSARRPATVPLPEASALASDGERPDQHVERRERQRQLAALLSALPELYRLPLVLRHVGGLSYAEMGEVLGCPVGTLKAQVSRGLQLLRQQVGPSPALEVE